MTDLLIKVTRVELGLGMAVNWEDLKEGENEESQGSKMIDFVVENMFVQWIMDNMKRDQDRLLRLVLVFITGLNNTRSEIPILSVEK